VADAAAVVLEVYRVAATAARTGASGTAACPRHVNNPSSRVWSTRKIRLYAVRQIRCSKIKIPVLFKKLETV
jgi:hypothetical protein